ncbi:MAG: hypothetical protein R6W69_09390 [Anaerolineales bacterium]
MNKFVVILVALAFLALAGCQPAEVVEPTQALEADETEEIPLPTFTPLVALPPKTDYCLECHTDKDRLVALATEKEDAHGSESEGVG